MGKIISSPITVVGILIILSAIFYFTCNLGSSNQGNNKLTPKEKTSTTVKINDVSIRTEIANTPETRTSGLSGRERLEEGQGMLFVFDKAAYHTFWMKNMNFPIDIIWISDNSIVDLSENIQPEKNSNLTIYKPSEPVKFVLEVNAGFSKKRNFKIEDPVEINPIQ